MWVRFTYDKDFQCQGWHKSSIGPGDDMAVEVPDHIIRRWDMIYELFCEVQIEAGEWKSRLWGGQRELPTRLSPMEVQEYTPRSAEVGPRWGKLKSESETVKRFA